MSIIGIDISKAKLDCAYLSEAGKVKTKVIANTSDGWQELLIWAQTTTKKETKDLHFVMEATGIYHVVSQHGYTIAARKCPLSIQRM
jgi:transposase